MTDHDLIKRLLDEAIGNVYLARNTKLPEDAENLERLLNAASVEYHNLNLDTIEEAFDVKGLHDRIHVCLVQIRATRHALDVIELSLDSALENVRRVGRMVEPDDEDADL